jgi:hypothetical protein
MDDETYIPEDPKDVVGRTFVHLTNKYDVSDKHKFQEKNKFYKKFLIWQAMDEKGRVSEPYVLRIQWTVINP